MSWLQNKLVEWIGGIEVQLNENDQRIAELEGLVGAHLDPGEFDAETAEVIRQCHRNAFPENYDKAALKGKDGQGE